MRSIILVAFAGWAFAGGSELDEARSFYNRAEFESSLRILQTLSVKNGAAYQLVGQNYFTQADYKKATEAFERAAALEPRSSEHFLWLGRAFGRRAETSNPLGALVYASRTRQYLEIAVHLNPENVEAQMDLFEYYLTAPSILGGGLEKAAVVAARITGMEPPEGELAQARLAEKRQDFRATEEHLQRAVELAPQQVKRLSDLAKFFVKQGRFKEADQSFARAEIIAPDNPDLLYTKADYYIKQKRNLAVARDLLNRYLKSTLTPDDPPKSMAAKLLQSVGGE